MSVIEYHTAIKQNVLLLQVISGWLSYIVEVKKKLDIKKYILFDTIYDLF